MIASATALPQDPGTPSHPTTLRPAGPLLLLLQLALGLVVLFGFTCAVVESVYWWSGPSLRGAQALGESLEPWTADPGARERIERLGADEIYTDDQLQEAAAVLRRVEWDWIRLAWLEDALLLLECYAAHPEWPAAPSADPSVSGTPRQGQVGGTRLLDHALAVRARTLALDDQRGLPVHLAELVGLGHDLGKLVTFRPDSSGYVRLLPHHDRMSAVLFASLPEWSVLLPVDQEDLATAVAFHHRRDRLPTRATSRARALLAEADETIRFQERHSMTRQGVPPPAEPAGEASPAPAPGPEESPAPAASPTALQEKLMQVLRELLPALRINTSTFDGRADVSREFVMLLGSALLGALTAQLSPVERGALGVPGEGGSDDLPSPTDRLPHPASAAIAGALRQLGWLIESWQGQAGILWQVKVGRRIWPVCWLLRTDAWPADLVSRWTAPTWPIEVIGPATGHAGLDHDLVLEPMAVPSPPGALVEDAPAPASPHAAGAPLLGEGLAGAASEREEMTHETPDAR